jgi:hypothetical protein
MPIAILPQRGVLEVAGEDRVAFLQGLVSNDVAAAGPGRAVFAALLTPQGKWLADFFIHAEDGPEGGRLLLDCERAQAGMLAQRLGRFRLRSKVALRDLSGEMTVAVGWGGAPMPAGAVADPRLEAAGWRLVAAEAPAADAAAEDWDAHRLALGLPEGSRDLLGEQSLLLEAGFDELHGVSWSKGCYMGQELTARTKYRGLLKRRLVPVEVEGPLPGPGTPVTAEGVEMGEMRSGRGARGIAQLRLEALDGRALRCGEAVIRPRIPGWMALPGEVAARG